jgi:hypothetical protein
MNKVAASLVFGVGLFLFVHPADGFVPRPAAEPRASAPVTSGAVIAKKAKPPKKTADKKADKAEGEDDSASKKPFPSKAESRKDIDDISKK